MAFVQVSFKLPEEYVRFLEESAATDDESQGYILQCAIYEQGRNALPPPRRRDKRPGTEEQRD